MGMGLVIQGNILEQAPGHQGTAALLEFDVGTQEPATMLLFVNRAGAAGDSQRMWQ